MVGGKPPFHGGLDRSLSNSDGALEGALLEGNFFFFCYSSSKIKVMECNSDCCKWRDRTWEKPTWKVKTKAPVNHLLVVPVSNNNSFLSFPALAFKDWSAENA